MDLMNFGFLINYNQMTEESTERAFNQLPQKPILTTKVLETPDSIQREFDVAKLNPTRLQEKLDAQRRIEKLKKSQIDNPS
ncbi:MAG: hypothetical protein UU02_C0002G0019 [Candidatus Woesebacteria bacterium GW2011_GWA1_40_43]|uniref:Uncharacterized protein n=1 Tax=Candidatus Woesebacteria bacterium GW2011_GWA1_40_43 TaxID=1618553 RepID=A0A0G0UYD9_9BACT|nr:MAG: hypothetical protein UT88_C0002G0003 [Candidatus Woesebacteria bacterium GW2011_GWD2_40_19]KKR64730.1 MAG: hypothetical protein UU02_C0002G0019 [Candidatus Woesebacteria bacterium GW2011_GWA1_40_43]